MSGKLVMGGVCILLVGASVMSCSPVRNSTCQRDDQCLKGVEICDSMSRLCVAAKKHSSPLAIIPAAKSLFSENRLTFAASGGSVPYTFSVLSGGGTIDERSGLFIAPEGASHVIIRVTDSAGSVADATVTVMSAPLVLEPTNKTIAVGNSLPLKATGGTKPYSFSIEEGPGNIDSISGLFTASVLPGTTVVRVTDAENTRVEDTITVNAALTVVPLAKTVTLNNSFRFYVIGGVEPYSFSIQSGEGEIGALTGVFTASSSAGIVTVRVTDEVGNFVDAHVSVKLPLKILPSQKTLAVGNQYSFVAVDGVAPYVFSIVNGVGNVGWASGMFTAANTAGDVILRVTDALGNNSDASITVNPNLAISPSIKTIAVGNYLTFTATGGVSPYLFSVASGGGSIDNETGKYFSLNVIDKAEIRVTDSIGNTSNADLTVRELFSPPVSYSLGGNKGPREIISDDWNHDGKSDLAVANANTNDVSIFLGIGDGSFQPPLSYSAGASVLSLASCDLNGDGHADLVASSYKDHSVEILIGLGNGAFESAVAYGAGTYPQTVLCRDWNGDKNLDLAVANDDTDNLHILLGVGDGSFGAAIPYPADGKDDNAFSMATGDWNEDGKADLVTLSNLNGTLSIYFGNSDGTFQFSTNFSTDSWEALSVTTDDLNDDGHLDLAVSVDEGIEISILFGLGDGTFNKAVTRTAGPRPRNLEVGDWNNDGEKDLIAVTIGFGRADVLLGIGDGTFHAPLSYPVGSQPAYSTVGDWNGDGKLDLATSNFDHTISIILNQSSD